MADKTKYEDYIKIKYLKKESFFISIKIINLYYIQK